MSSEDIYRTIEHPSEGIYKEKGSKFLAFAWPIESEEEVKEKLAEMKTRYHDARHHCFAWQLGLDGMNYRVNDDGEPSGTAGKPIYGQIRSKELSNILVLVVRYFGGTKLGVSGLINAYKAAAADVLANSKIVERTVNSVISFHFPYESLNDVMKVIKEEAPEIIHQKFDLSCSIILSIRQSREEELKERLKMIDHLVLE
ncbi:MAG TPA: YigZ family protein [Marinilabiliaceae bacterium]|nr:YigZ family protein [Marinilabiliaceae bacterium]